MFIEFMDRIELMKGAYHDWQELATPASHAGN
jgi:hypothetical protein